MKPILFSPLVSAAVAASLVLSAGNTRAGAQADQTRTIYFSALTEKGESITDLVAGDLTVKEGGKVREVASVQPATQPMSVSILVDDLGRGSFQSGVVQFINETLGRAEYAVSLLNPQPVKLVDYTADMEALKTAVLKLEPRGRIDQTPEQAIDAVQWAAKDLVKRKPARPVIIVLTNVGEPGLTDHADAILKDLQNSGASLHVIYGNGLTLGKVLGDGPKFSGGSKENAGVSQVVAAAMSRLAVRLQHQYTLTYTLPAGTKLDSRLQLASTRKGVTLVAPQQIPDK